MTEISNLNPCFVVGTNLVFDGVKIFRWLGEIIFIAPDDISKNFRRDFDHWSVGVSNGVAVCINRNHLREGMILTDGF